MNALRLATRRVAAAAAADVNSHARRSLVVKATCKEPQDTSNMRVVAPSSMSYQLAMKRYAQEFNKYMQSEQTITLSEAEKDKCYEELGAAARRAGGEGAVDEAWLRSNIQYRDEYKLSELNRGA